MQTMDMFGEDQLWLESHRGDSNKEIFLKFGEGDHMVVILFVKGEEDIEFRIKAITEGSFRMYYKKESKVPSTIRITSGPLKGLRGIVKDNHIILDKEQDGYPIKDLEEGKVVFEWRGFKILIDLHTMNYDIVETPTKRG